MSRESATFRLIAAVALVTAVGLVSVAVEKQILILKRAVSLQHYQAARLYEERARIRFQTEQQKSPARLLQQWAQEHHDRQGRPSTR